MTDKAGLKIVFFGTPEFAVASLKAILEAGYNVAAVVTAPDKPAGRGYALQQSAVKKFAVEKGLEVLQPINLKSDDFYESLKAVQADLQIIIAFRMLPERIWNMPPLGTFNLHASYLPLYRGAAPINRAIMNGETSTGVTTFFLKHEIDTGSIILREKVAIDDSDNAGSLHDKLMQKGSELVVDSLEKIAAGNVKLTEQEQGDFPHAPKIFTEDCRIVWNQPASVVRNQIRGLSPYPAAFTTADGKKIKIFAAELYDVPSVNPGLIEIAGKDLLIHCSDYKLKITELQPEGKKRMPVADFLNGFRITEPVIAQ